MFSFRKVFINIVFKRNLVNMSRVDELSKHSFEIFTKSVEAVKPDVIIHNCIRKVSQNEYVICNNSYTLHKNCYIIGFGKAVFSMSIAALDILCCHLVSGIVSIPTGTLTSTTALKIPKGDHRLTFIEGAENNIPDVNSEKAAKSIAELAKTLGKDDLLIVLISGGGSSLLPYPKPPITLSEKAELIKNLSNRGATIQEMNTVRKQISELKGGGLAKLAYPARVISLILSDIIGDPVDLIASGPTCSDSNTPDSAMKIIQKYGLNEHLPSSIQSVLTSSVITDHDFSHVTNCVIGNNLLAARKARNEAERLGYQSCIISVSVCGDVNLISHAYSSIAVEIAKVMKGYSSRDSLRECLENFKTLLHISEDAINELISLNFNSPICLIASGEPTIHVTGSGKGGRNQQLALQFAVDTDKAHHNTGCDISLLSCGTDGIDGPTDAAGAFGFPEVSSRSNTFGLNPIDFLANNDTYNFYQQLLDGKYLFKIGHTGTNVMDLHVLIVAQNN